MVCTILALSGCGSADAHLDTKLPYGLIAPDSAIHHFGEHRQGEQLRHVFSLLNNTERTVKIVELNSSCQCVVAGGDELGSLTIPPRQRFQLPVSIKTSGSQDEAAGRVIVRYCDAADEKNDFRGEYALVVKADVLPAYRINPSVFDFGTIDGLQTQTATKTVRIVPVDVKNLSVDTLRATTEFLTLKLAESKSSGTDILLDITLDVTSFSSSRKFEGMVTFETNCERARRGAIPVRGRYVAAVEAQPESVILSSAEQGEVERAVHLISARPSRIVSLGLPAGQLLRARWAENTTATDHIVTFVISPVAQSALHAEIPVEIEFPAANQSGSGIRRTVTIPVSRFPLKEKSHG